MRSPPQPPRRRALARSPRLPLHPQRSRDLALGPSLFHWESQSTTSAASATGQRYESHEGERPMAIRWKLERKIPAAWLLVMGLAV